jgi:hypothetical protein
MRGAYRGSDPDWDTSMEREREREREVYTDTRSSVY